MNHKQQELMAEFLELLNDYDMAAGLRAKHQPLPGFDEARQNIINFFQLGLEQGHFYEKHHHS